MPTPQDPYYEDDVTREHIGEDFVDAGEELESLHKELLADLGLEEQPVHDGDSEDAAKKLASEHGPDYHGFGHPPEPPTD